MSKNLVKTGFDVDHHIYAYDCTRAFISLIFSICLGVRSHIECIKLLLQLIRFDYFCLLLRMKTRLQFLTNANNSQILENNAR